MADGKDTAVGGFLREMSRSAIYKRTQGRWTRQVTAVAIALGIAIGAWVLREQSVGVAFRIWVPLAIVALGVWLAYRVVNIPRFADFLIAVEAEMNKVSWPSKPELIRGSVVVIAVMFTLAAALTLYDVIWVFLLRGLGVR